MIIDDVISAGTSIKDSVDIIESEGGTVAGAIVAVNRQERGEGELSAIQEAQNRYGIKIMSIVNLDDIISYISESNKFKKHLGAIKAYRKKYGEIST